MAISSSAQILVNLFSFIVKEGNRDLDPNHYQLVFKREGLGISLVIRYIQGQDKESKLGTIGL